MVEEELLQLDDGRRLRCSSIVRLLPGKRKVCRGSLEGKPVFVKLYLDGKRGRRHWQRELEGLRAFRERDVLTASIVYAGEIEGKTWPVILLEQLQDPVDLKEAWENAESSVRESLLDEMVGLLARHHAVGICQTDLHLSNFVISQNRIYSLDGAGVKTVNGELGRRAALDNLALFLAQLLPAWDSRVSELYQSYCDSRGWRSCSDRGGRQLLRRVRRARERRWKDFRKKLYRDCTAFRCRKMRDRLEIVSRQDLSPELEAFLRSPDDLIENTEAPPVDARLNGDITSASSDFERGILLKDGVTCKVWALKIGNVSVVVKRYNIKPLWRRIKFRLLFGRGLLSSENANLPLFFGLIPGRALISWENAHMLRFFGVQTPRPMAVLRIGRDAIHSASYFMTEAVAGIRATWWFLDERIPQAEKSQMATKVALLLRHLAELRISHGDLKAANILIVGATPVLIDLDAMVRHKSRVIFRYHWGRDIQRFLEAWEHVPEVQQMMQRALIENGVGPLRSGVAP